MADKTAVDYVPLEKDGGTATNLTHSTGSLGTAVTAVTQAPSTNNTTVATTAYTDAAVAASASGLVDSVSGTANRISIGGTAADPVVDIDAAYVGQASITTLGTITTGVWNGTDVPVTAGGTGASDAGTARTNLGLAIGTNVQAYDATLNSIAALGTGADKTIYTTGVDTWAETDLTAQARALLDDTTQLAQAQTILDNVGVTAATVASTDKILGLDVDDSGNLKSFTAQSIADLAGAGSSGVDLVATATASASATIDFDDEMDSTYEDYFITGSGINFGTDNVGAWCRVGTGSPTPTYHSGASDYNWSAQKLQGSVTVQDDTSDSEIEMASTAGGSNIGSDAFSGDAFVMHIPAPSNSTYRQLLWGDFIFLQTSAIPAIVRSSFCGQYKATTAVTSIRFSPTSGNFDTGEFKLYGLKKTV